MSIIIMNARITCKVTVDCLVHPSESGDKIKAAISGIVPEADAKIERGTARAVFENTDCLDKIRTVIESRKSQNAYKKRLYRNADENSSWFMLNKQAAYAGKVALCDDEEDSPMGAIRIRVECHDLERLIEWLAPFA